MTSNSEDKISIEDSPPVKESDLTDHQESESENQNYDTAHQNEKDTENEIPPASPPISDVVHFAENDTEKKDMEDLEADTIIEKDARSFENEDAENISSIEESLVKRSDSADNTKYENEYQISKEITPLNDDSAHLDEKDTETKISSEDKTIFTDVLYFIENNNEKNDDKEANTITDKYVYSLESEGTDASDMIPCKLKKKFLGGYRHKLTGVEYHHAATQTMPPPWKYRQVERFHRDCQVIVTFDQYQQTPKDAWTQVDVKGLYLCHSGDKFLSATDKYVFADQIKENRLNKVIVLQKYARVWLCRRELLRRKKAALLQILWDKEQEKQHTNFDIDWLQELKRRRANPKSKDDFTLLFSDLQSWWNAESKLIAEARTGADLKAAMWMLVDAETKKIDEINEKRKLAEDQQDFEGRQRFLSKTAEPKLWKAYKTPIIVETENSHKGKTLHELYTTLCLEGLSTQDRIDALISLKGMVKVHSCDLTNNLIKLANREIDLLLRGTKPKLLEGLRTRIKNLFWQYSRQPIFNPEAKKLSRMKQKDRVPPHILSCASCKRFYILPPDTNDEVIGMSVLEKRFIKCKKCLYLENESWIRKDLELHKRILKLLILEEKKKSSISGIIYLLRPPDVGHLVDKIWRRESCLSGSMKGIELEFARWNMNESWTPWNCILVTRHEAATLNSLADPKTYYDKKFRKIVARRHLEARKSFSKIPRFLPYLSEHFNAVDISTSSDEENLYDKNQ